MESHCITASLQAVFSEMKVWCFINVCVIKLTERTHTAKEHTHVYDSAGLSILPAASLIILLSLMKKDVLLMMYFIKTHWDASMFTVFTVVCFYFSQQCVLCLSVKLLCLLFMVGFLIF